MEGNKTILGTCSLCGGTVSVPTISMSIVPPNPKCESCGAVQSRGHVIQMEPVRQGRYPQDYSNSSGGCDYHRRYC